MLLLVLNSSYIFLSYAIYKCFGAVPAATCCANTARFFSWFCLRRTTMLAEPTPSRCTWHHCVPFSPEPKWSVNPPNVSCNRYLHRFLGCNSIACRCLELDGEQISWFCTFWLQDGPWGNNDGGRGYIDDDQNAYTEPWKPWNCNDCCKFQVVIAVSSA